jgi:hypothetical protein
VKPLVALSAGGVVLVLVIAWLAWPPGKSEPTAEVPAPAPSPPSPSPVRAAPVGARTAPTLAKGGARAEIQRATAAASAEVTLANLDQYLDSLERRARAQGRVTALEVSPATSVIEELTGDMERAARFAMRMEKLQKELEAKAGGGAPAASPAETAAALDRLAGSIKGETDPGRRNQLVRDYISKARALGDESEAAAMRRLESLLQKLPGAPAVDRDRLP